MAAEQGTATIRLFTQTRIPAVLTAGTGRHLRRLRHRWNLIGQIHDYFLIVVVTPLAGCPGKKSRGSTNTGTNRGPFPTVASHGTNCSPDLGPGNRNPNRARKPATEAVIHPVELTSSSIAVHVAIPHPAIHHVQVGQRELV